MYVGTCIANGITTHAEDKGNKVFVYNDI